MANILLLGSSSAIRLFSSQISSEHTLYVYPLDAAGEPFDARLVPVSSAPEVPRGIDAIVDLDWSGAARARYRPILEEAASDATLLFVSTLTTTATAVAAELPGHPVIGISFVPALFALSDTVEVAPALQTSREDFDRAVALLRGLHRKQIEVVEDRVALVSMRVLAMIINEAAFALMEGVAGAEDVDVAMKLGTNYPEGPLRWADSIGADVVTAILQALYEEYGEERYRPCVLLKQYARAGRSFYAASPAMA